MGKPVTPVVPWLPPTGGRPRPPAGGGAARSARATASPVPDTSDRRCPLCMKTKPYTAFGTGSKARYCRACEKLRWMGRKRGLKVDALRVTIEELAGKDVPDAELIELAVAKAIAMGTLPQGYEAAPLSREGTLERDGGGTSGALPSDSAPPPAASGASASPERSYAAADGGAGDAWDARRRARSSADADDDAELAEMTAKLEGGAGGTATAAAPASPRRWGRARVRLPPDLLLCCLVVPAPLGQTVAPSLQLPDGGCRAECHPPSDFRRTLGDAPSAS